MSLHKNEKWYKMLYTIAFLTKNHVKQAKQTLPESDDCYAYFAKLHISPF